jgi:hypothetical protein
MAKSYPTEVIRDCNGYPIHRSRNLAGIRRYVGGRHAPAIKKLSIGRIGTNGMEGKMLILFDDGSSFETNFVSYRVLLRFVQRWRNVHGAPFLVNGIDCGAVHSGNPAFKEAL